MRAWVLDDSAGKPKLVMWDVPQPRAGPEDVLVDVQAAGVTPTELLSGDRLSQRTL